MSQAETVVAHINKWGSINSIEAIRLYGITRLARVIHDLKGTADQMEAVKDKSSEGNFVKYVPDIKGRVDTVVRYHTQVLNNATAPISLKIKSCLEAASVLTALQQEGL